MWTDSRDIIEIKMTGLSHDDSQVFGSVIEQTQVVFTELNQSGGDKILWQDPRVLFWPFLFEILTRHPGGDVEQAVGYVSPAFREKSGMEV